MCLSQTSNAQVRSSAGSGGLTVSLCTEKLTAKSFPGTTKSPPGDGRQLESLNASNMAAMPSCFGKSTGTVAFNKGF